MTFKEKACLIDAKDMQRTIRRLAHEILEWNHGVDKLAIIGIQTRGVYLCERIAQVISEIEETSPAMGRLDITFYRDDFRTRLRQPELKGTHVHFELEGLNVVLVDDVLYTGRTVRAALDAVMDIGRPENIRLAVLVDRGHRQLPIRADFIGRNIPTAEGEEVQVQMREMDERDAVYLLEMEGED
jgi:pyrimidine operon attenuation protein / uracil phosphoribosyltransferase